MMFSSQFNHSKDLPPSVITLSAQPYLSNNPSSHLSRPTLCLMTKRARKRIQTVLFYNLTQTRPVSLQLNKFRGKMGQFRLRLPPTLTLMTKICLQKKRSREPKRKVQSQTGAKALRTRSIVTVSPSAHMPLIPIMLMVCARIATMLKEEQRWLPSVNIQTASCMQKVSAETATSASTTRHVDWLRRAAHPITLNLQLCN